MRITIRKIVENNINYFNENQKLPLQSDNPFMEILESTFNVIEYNTPGMINHSIGIINKSMIEEFSKEQRRCIDIQCNVNDNVLFEYDRLERIVSIKENEEGYDSRFKYVTIKNIHNSDDISIMYYISWNNESNCVNYYSGLTIFSKDHFEKVMDENKISEELIARLLYTKNHFNHIKSINTPSTSTTTSSSK